MVLEPSRAALGGLLARLGEAKCAKRAALTPKIKILDVDPSVGENQGRIEGHPGVHKVLGTVEDWRDSSDP